MEINKYGDDLNYSFHITNDDGETIFSYSISLSGMYNQGGSWSGSVVWYGKRFHNYLNTLLCPDMDSEMYQQARWEAEKETKDYCSYSPIGWGFQTQREMKKWITKTLRDHVYPAIKHDTKKTIYQIRRNK